MISCAFFNEMIDEMIDSLKQWRETSDSFEEIRHSFILVNSFLPLAINYLNSNRKNYRPLLKFSTACNSHFLTTVKTASRTYIKICILRKHDTGSGPVASFVTLSRAYAPIRSPKIIRFCISLIRKNNRDQTSREGKTSKTKRPYSIYIYIYIYIYHAS